MYGLNNNTGTAYSQANSNIRQLNKKVSNADKGKKITNNLISGIEALNGLQSDKGIERLKAGAKLIAMASGASI